MTWTRVMRADDLWIGEMRSASIEGRRLLLINLEGELRAFEDRCAHQGVPLSEGRLAGGVLTCSAHEWQYDVATGQGLNPCGVTLKTFPVEVRDGAIWVDLPETRVELHRHVDARR